MIKDFRFKLFNHNFVLNIMHQMPIQTWGILNRTSDNFFVPFFEYDDVNYNVISEDIDFLNKHFQLGSLLVRKSSEETMSMGEKIGSYHIIGFCRLTIPELREIFKYIRCDRSYKNGFRLSPERAWVLRVGQKLNGNKIEKPQGVKTEFFKFKTSRTLSSGIYKFFQMLDGLPRIRAKWDGLFETFLINYQTHRTEHNNSDKECYIWKPLDEVKK